MRGDAFVDTTGRQYQEAAQIRGTSTAATGKE
jgi:hypothetical protein